VEHRWGQRQTVNTSARIVVDARIVAPARLLDFSLSGGFIETELDFVPLTRLTLEIDFLDGRTAGALLIDAYVVRRAAGGYGIEWHKLSADNLPTAWVQEQLRESAPQAHAVSWGKRLALCAARHI
jgi:hypothetical protein